MNRTLLSAALLLSFAAPAAFAQAAAVPAPAPVQQQAKHAHTPHRTAMHMAKKLNLSPDQTAKVEPILADRKAKMDALKADTTLTPDQKKAQRKEIQRSTHDSLAGVLTPEQMSNLKQMHRDHKRNAAAANTQS